MTRLSNVLLNTTPVESRHRLGPTFALVLDVRPDSMNKLRLISPAEWEYTEALCWYAERSQRAAEGLDVEFDKALMSIAADPLRFPKCDDRHHFYLMDRYPFQVIYRQEADEVIVIAVAHAKRKPEYWKGR